MSFSNTGMTHRSIAYMQCSRTSPNAMSARLGGRADSSNDINGVQIRFDFRTVLQACEHLTVNPRV